MAIVLRSEKGSELTHEEMDANFATIRKAEFAIKGVFDSPYGIDLVDVSNLQAGLSLTTPLLYVSVKGNYAAYYNDGYGTEDFLPKSISGVFPIKIEENETGGYVFSSDLGDSNNGTISEGDGILRYFFNSESGIEHIYDVTISVLSSQDLAVLGAVVDIKENGYLDQEA